MNVAHIENGTVANIVVLTDGDAIASPQAAEQFCTATFGGEWVHSPDSAPAFIGYGYDPKTGFEQPPPFNPSSI